MHTVPWIYVGIDPGLGGAVAAIDAHKRVIALQDTPTVEITRGRKRRREYADVHMADIIRRLNREYHVVAVALEDVHAMPQQGVTSTFHFGEGKGLWRGIIAAERLPIILVAPHVWKKEMLGSGSANDKGLSIRQALRLSPKSSELLARRKDEGRAEALLLAMYLLRTTGSASRTAKRA